MRCDRKDSPIHLSYYFRVVRYGRLGKNSEYRRHETAERGRPGTTDRQTDRKTGGKVRVESKRR